MTYAVTERTTVNRHAERASYDRAAAWAILDEAYVGHLGFVADGGPRVLPMLIARVADTLYLHGSTGTRYLLEARDGGLDVCVEVTLLDGLVYAHSHFNHSANYRCVVAYGRARLVTEEAEKRRALGALVDRLGAGRAADAREPDAKELAATAVLGLSLDEVSVKVRTGGPLDNEADQAPSTWAGVVPLRLVAGAPVTAGEVTAPPPAYLPAAGRR